jgi:hypothetical protein
MHGPLKSTHDADIVCGGLAALAEPLSPDVAAACGEGEHGCRPGSPMGSCTGS